MEVLPEILSVAENCQSYSRTKIMKCKKEKRRVDRLKELDKTVKFKEFAVGSWFNN